MQPYNTDILPETPQIMFYIYPVFMNTQMCHATVTVWSHDYQKRKVGVK